MNDDYEVLGAFRSYGKTFNVVKVGENVHVMTDWDFRKLLETWYGKRYNRYQKRNRKTA